MTRLTKLLMAAAAVMLSACGGGGGSSISGIGGTGITYGPVSGFGSLLVNGTQYSNTAATYTGEVNSAAGLDVGMVVTVQHSNNVAERIDYRDNAEGAVMSINLAGNSMVVMGLTVNVNNLTVFANTTGLAALAVNDVVEVSGLIEATNVIRATRVERKGICSTYVGTREVKGTVTNLNTGATTFNIGSMVVNYGSATMLDVFTGNSYVEVKSANCPSAGVLTASSVEIETLGPELGDLDDGDDVEIKGFVNNLAGSGSTRTFTLNGRTVTTSSTTQYEAGTSVATLANGKLVEVHGDISLSGTLVARQIEFEDEGEGDSRVEILAVPTAKTRTAFNTGTLTLLGITVQVDPTTQFRGSDSNTAFNLDTIVANSTCLEVRAYQQDGAVVATSVEEEDDCSPVELQGPVSAIADPNVTVLGVTIATSGATTFRDANGFGIDKTQFFSALSTGVFVDAKGSFASGILTASEIELEN